MRKLFCLFGLFAISLSASAASEWFYYKNFPWVYDNVTEDWLYLRGTNDGKFYAYRNSTKEWEEFTVPEPTWEEKYQEWIFDPEPYGGLEVLQQIKDAKDSGATVLWLSNKNISDITPLAELTNLRGLRLKMNNITDITPLTGLTKLMELGLSENNISDISPLAGMTNLMWVNLGDNPIPASQQAMLEEALPNTYISWDQVSNNPPDDDIESNEEVDIGWIMWMQNPEPYGGLEVLQQIKDAKESGATELHLGHNNISDVTPLAELTNLKILWLYDNNISDIAPLAGLTNLTLLALDNNIAASQKAMLVEALPNTNIQWSDVIIDDSVETEKTWDEKYEEWILDPEPYGGLDLLQLIKVAKESGYTQLDLSWYNLSDITPLAGLTNLKGLYLYNNNITDITPLAGLTNLTELELYNNYISDITPLAGLTNLRVLNLADNNISDVSPLTGLTKLTRLYLSSNNITDITPLAGLTNLWVLNLADNNITDSQKTMLESALPNTSIIW